ncbi:hypothetical protein LshimejAT787_1104710 [Lyophyllum shimeji]|uniref:Uncharacterized protein n=1 Tax=Lyophyllum shimeji TaxID=47721 RepID=A0A9P3PVJ6_LYOSH|nr:hypothetical protein LshimejAT787_1104710 [Lyophyllum shimeji]
MATTTQNPPPLSRFSRLGLGLGLKSSSASQSRARGNQKQGAEDEWYIPYSGSYEPPREQFRRQKERDSWGDPVDGEDDVDDDTVMASVELHKRYVVRSNTQAGEGRWNGGGDNQKATLGGDRHSLKLGQRDRAQSSFSGRTVSSGVVDPTRASVASQRRSTVSSAQRPRVPSYINLDAAAGVGASPVPLTHKRNSSREGNRVSFAGLFTFAGQPRGKLPADGGTKGLFSRKLSRSGRPATGIGSGIGPTNPSHRRSSSTGSNSVLGRSKTLHGSSRNGAETTDHDDYYSSYYFSSWASQSPSTTNPPAQAAHPDQSGLSTTQRALKTSPSSTPSSSSRHPYAYAFPTSHADGPQTAPLLTSNFRDNPPPSGSLNVDPRRLTFNQPPLPMQNPASANVAQSKSSFAFPFQKSLMRLKNSASTPDLRLRPNPSANISLNAVNAVASKAAPTIKSKDRWLSPETWCDALLFPRPRLKIKHDFSNGGSGRTVSPPESPVQRGLDEPPSANGVVERGIASRVLAHSRSLIDLNKTTGDAAVDERPINSRTGPEPSSTQTRLAPPSNGIPPPIRTDRPPRPKSWALDDLALPSPVPSLAWVLEEGEKLQSERKQWQEQATQSFQNKRTRSVSRSRSKSLTQKGRKPDDTRPSNIDFLAARACLGNQLLTPVIAPPKLPDTQIGSLGSKSSHSHSNSLVKTLTKSSKSHSRGHSRADSWGRSAFKTAKTAAGGLVGTGSAGLSPSYAPDNGLESILRGGGTKIIRLADPALGVPSDNEPLTSISPTPSGSEISDARIGIALSTPPLVDSSVDLDAMRLPSHPYAQGGMYSYSKYVPAPQPEKHVVAGPSKRNSPTQDDAEPRLLEAQPLQAPTRHHEPRPSVPYHPYAHHASSSESYDADDRLVARPREDSDIPSPAKMWAQLSPGFVREILPGDIQYSPFMSENGDVSNRNSRVIYDTFGVGETLANAVRPKTSQDSGLGLSEEHTVVDPGQPQMASLSGKRSYRQPVQYDTSRPPHLHLSQQEHKPADPHSPHTFASSPFIYQQTPSLDVPRKYSDEIQVPRTTSTSPESLSPPHSPHSFGNSDDFEKFYDLFYKPTQASGHQSVLSETGGASASGAPFGSRRRTGSGLTSLARQLSQEFDRLALEREGSQYSRSTVELQGSIGRRPTDSTLEFVFEETSPPESSATGQSPPSGHSRFSPFQPSSVHIPEDVESSRASSPLEPDGDETELFHVGVVESVSTPPAVASDHRSSYIGEVSSPNNHERPQEAQELAPISPQPRINSGLQPPSADPTRSSYMTTSTASRMSNLSDFPAPPPHLNGHTSLLTSYFDEAHSLSEAQATESQYTTAPSKTPSFNDSDDDDTHNRRLTFGGEQEIEELVAALSSHSHSTAGHSYP